MSLEVQHNVILPVPMDNFLIGIPAKIYNPQKFSTSLVQWPHQLLLVQTIDSLICVINTIFEMTIMQEPLLCLDTTTTMSFLSLLLASAAMAVRNHS